MNTSSFSENQSNTTYLTFLLEGNEFAVDVAIVQEILKMKPIIQKPDFPDTIKGVVNLRGLEIPVYDTRLKFGFESREMDENTCVIVLNLDKNDKPSKYGLMVDTVKAVLKISESEIISGDDSKFFEGSPMIYGIAKSDSGTIYILNVLSLFDENVCFSIQYK